MSEAVTRRCDNRFMYRRKIKTCGNPIPEDRPTVFSIGDTAYAVDLCDECKLRFAEAVAPFVEIARPEFIRVNGAVRKAIRAQNGEPFPQADVRKWLRENGVRVSHTGRIKQEYIDDYKDAMGLP